MPAASSLLLLLPALAGLGTASPLAGGPKTHARQTSWTVGQPVRVRAGTVRGAASRVRPEVSAYLGIPFAQPPTGQQRFMPPVAVTSFSSAGNSTDNSTAFDASDFGPDCPSNHSKHMFVVEMDGAPFHPHFPECDPCFVEGASTTMTILPLYSP